jgi:surface antigen
MIASLHPIHSRPVAVALVALAALAAAAPSAPARVGGATRAVAARHTPGHPSVSTHGRRPSRHARPRHSGKGGAVAANPYTHGGCTFWAWANRTDLPGNLGNARNWAANAARAGFPVDGRPEVGAIAVYQPGVYGAFAPYGHVAVVTQVAGSRILISEASYNPRFPDYGDHEIYHRWTGIVQVQFIHRKTAPVTPPTTPPSPPASTTAPPPPTASPQFTNRLLNPGFESVPGIPSWFRNNLADGVNWSVYSDTGVAHGGTWFVQTNTAQAGGSISQDLPLPPAAGDVYRFSVWMRSAGGQPYTACPTIWALGTPNTPAQTCATVGAAWQQVTTTMVVPSGGQFSRLRVEIYESTPHLNLDLDDASLVGPLHYF